jgi:hypothetical protein
MHQGWPKFVQNLWYATADNGLAALVYGPSEVTAKVAGGEEVTITEETNYPFSEHIRFSIQTEKKVKFPFHLRVPEWCKNPVVRINGEEINPSVQNNIIILYQEWTSGDNVELTLNMDFRYSRWYENSLGIERGPLVYALKIDEDWREVTKEEYHGTFWEIYPQSTWSYVLSQKEIERGNLLLEQKEEVAVYPWNLENAPVTVKTKARRLTRWQMENGSTGKIPLTSYLEEDEIVQIEEEITLIPYGCTTLRISQFPTK